MATFAIIAEGQTDQRVIENVLWGFFGADEGAPQVTFVQPPFEPASAPGGWTLLFKALKKGDVGTALAFNDYVIVHVDTDVCEDVGFDVLRRAGGRALSVDELIAAVTERLRLAIGEVAVSHSERIIFAIAVDTIECWLLPLLLEGQNTKAAKTTSCLAAANDALRAANRDLLTKGGGKELEGYRKASAGYSKRKILFKHRKRNASLDRFVALLEAL